MEAWFSNSIINSASFPGLDSGGIVGCQVDLPSTIFVNSWALFYFHLNISSPARDGATTLALSCVASSAFQLNIRALNESLIYSVHGRRCRSKS